MKQLIQKTTRIGLSLFLLAGLLAGFLALSGTPAAHAAGAIIVNSDSDAVANDGLCTLREAILNANNDDQSGSTDCAAGSGADTITFAGNYTILLEGQLPKVTSTVTINGNGEAKRSFRVAVLAYLSSRQYRRPDHQRYDLEKRLCRW
jgi:CSLREA domain-containing protein